jgi:glucose-6-phosphate 1-dehydrogenase
MPLSVKQNLTTSAPTVFVIFGVSGDLSRRKLIPALLDLKSKKVLPKVFRILGVAKDELTISEFQQIIAGAIRQKKHQHSAQEVKQLLNRAVYQAGFFEDAQTYKRISQQLKKIDNEIGQCTNKLFYLAVPPPFFETILKNLAKFGLTKACGGRLGWTRVLIEKPFGKDYQTAKKLDQLLGRLFQEEQVFRIDHYLAKETIQNILTFRFSNLIFDPIWNNKFIDRVEVRLLEKLDASGRGSFYDGVGALRDVGQNHILQMLSLIAMEHPGRQSAGAIRREKAKVLRALKTIKPSEIKKSVIRGQYQGFRKEKGVKPKSQTETYFKIKAFINNRRWQGVPFYLESGKALNEDRVEINVYFKAIKPCFCPIVHQGHNHRNIINFQIQPQKSINIRFWAKRPGLTADIEPKDLSFNYSEGTEQQFAAYEKVLFDCVAGDHTLFAGSQEVESSWKFIESILKGWGKSRLYKYKKGSAGPEIKNF